MKNTEENKMFAELKTRSFLGKLYSEYYLYPKIKTYLSGHLLDYGAGIGAYSSYYKKKGGTVTSAEVNFKCIEYMKTINLKTIKIANNSLESDNSIYDSVLLDNVLEHIDDPIKVLKVREKGWDCFIEIEVNELTLEILMETIKHELEIDNAQDITLKKLPNILIRNNKDVNRLVDGQEIEFVRVLELGTPKKNC